MIDKDHPGYVRFGLSPLKTFALNACLKRDKDGMPIEDKGRDADGKYPAERTGLKVVNPHV